MYENTLTSSSNTPLARIANLDLLTTPLMTASLFELQEKVGILIGSKTGDLGFKYNNEVLSNREVLRLIGVLARESYGQVIHAQDTRSGLPWSNFPAFLPDNRDGFDKFMLTFEYLPTELIARDKPLEIDFNFSQAKHPDEVFGKFLSDGMSYYFFSKDKSDSSRHEHMLKKIEITCAAVLSLNYDWDKVFDDSENLHALGDMAKKGYIIMIQELGLFFSSIPVSIPRFKDTVIYKELKVSQEDLMAYRVSEYIREHDVKIIIVKLDGFKQLLEDTEGERADSEAARIVGMTTLDFVLMKKVSSMIKDQNVSMGRMIILMKLALIHEQTSLVAQKFLLDDSLWTPAEFMKICESVSDSTDFKEVTQEFYRQIYSQRLM